MRTLSAIFMTISLVGITAIATAQDLPVVTAVKAQQPITVDGSLDEEVWQEGEWCGEFRLLGKPELKAEAQTRFKIAFDDENIYIGAVLDEPNMDQLKATVSERDGWVHRDDCLEFMIDPQGERTEYFHFTVNVLGTVYDSEVRQGGHVMTKEWNCPWEVGVTKQAASWTVEVRVPVVYLGLTAASSGDWALNVARERQAGQQELSAFINTLGGFHQPANYAVLKLPGADFSKYLWDIKSPFEVTVLPRDGRLVYQAKTHITNETGRFWFFSVAPGLQMGTKHETGARVPQGLDAGQGREMSFSVPVAEQGKQTLQIRLLDRRNPRRILAVKTLPVELSYSPITIDVTQPCYRNSIYATEDLREIKANVHLALTDDEVDGTVIKPALMHRTKLVSSGDAVKVAESVEVAVPIKDLADGSYRLVVTAEKAGAVLHRQSVPITKLPPAPNGHEWRLDENNVLLHNGEPYLIYGWFGGTADELADPNLPYTASQYYSAQWYDSEKVRQDFFDPMTEAGSFITIYPYPNTVPRRMMGPEDWQRPLNEEEKTALRQRIAELKDHPAVWAWYLADEPELRPALPQRMREIYEIIRDEDPYHPQLLLNDTIAGIYKYAGSSDIFIPDPYPLFIEGGDAASPIGKTSKFMQACYEAGGGRKGLMITPQAFNYGDYGRLGNRAPNFTELRNQAYQAIVNRTTGILWYTHSAMFNYPASGLGVAWIGHEIMDLKGAVLSPPVEGLEISAEQPEEVQASLRRVGDDIYLFVVNTSTEAQQITVKMPDAAPAELTVVSESRTVPVKDGAVTDRFEKYATHIYTTDKELGSRAQVQDALTEIAAAEQAMKKPGNLAFKDSGVVVEASSSRGDHEMKAVDGAMKGLAWCDNTYLKLPDWLSLTWPEPQTIGRVVIYTGSIADLKLQVPDENTEDGWRSITEVQELDQPSVALEFEPMQIKSFRIFSTKLRGDGRFSTIHEVEAYAK